MNLYIRKSDEAGRGEAREGNYATRVVEGYEKDGSPSYRYFKTMDEYKTYVKNKNKQDSPTKKKKPNEKSGKDLKDKVESEQAQTKRKMKASDQKKKNLFVQSKNKKANDKKNAKTNETTKKSLRLFIG